MPGPSTTSPRRLSSRGGAVSVELVRLAVVVLATGAAYEVASGLRPSVDLDGVSLEPDALRLGVTVVGAGVGYVLGGMFGRFSLGRMDAVERQLGHISGGELLAAVLGGLAGLLVALGVAWPVLLFDGKAVTLPLAALTATLLVSAGTRIGFRRGGDLLRFVGASGRLSVATPSRGATAKIVDTSALVDGRLLEVCRSGFLEGTLVLPRFVLYELQGLADAGDEERRTRGRRGLDVLAGLQRSSGVALEVTNEDYPEIEAVDAKLIAMARDRAAALVTVDGNLARVAEVQDVHVLNLASLAETLRPPVLPGDLLKVRLTKPGREAGQAVGYLADGTMVVTEGAAEHVGQQCSVEVTSILSNPRGRMVFGTLVPSEPSMGWRSWDSVTTGDVGGR